MCADGKLGKEGGGNSEHMYSDTPVKVAKDLESSTSSQVSPPGFQRGSVQIMDNIFK